MDATLPHARTGRSALPPGPRERFPFENLLKLHRDPLGYLTGLAREYGDIVHFRGGSLDAFLLNHPDLVKETLVTHNRALPIGIWQRQARRLLGNALITSEGAEHLRQRRLMSFSFHHSRLENLSRFTAEFTDDWVIGPKSSWRAGQVVETAGDFWKLTLKIVAQSLFTSDVSDELQDLLETTDGLAALASPAMIYFADPILRLPLPLTRRFDRARQRLDETIFRIIAEHRANPGQDDLLAVLLDVRDEDGSALSDQELRDQTLTLLMAGHGTTSIALMWAFYLLSQHPEQEMKFLSEIDRVVPARVPTVRDLRELPFTRAVFAEALRLYPPVWAQDREAAHDLELGGYRIPKDSVVLVSQWVTQRDRRFFENPDEFLPERWIDQPELYKRGTVYFPFGLGPRICIGEDYAWLNGILILATIARRWRLRLLAGHKIELFPRSGLGSRHGMRMVCERRT
jgi:cytochrome P450